MNENFRKLFLFAFYCFLSKYSSSLVSGATSPSATFCTNLGEITYQYDCPCFRHLNETFNQVFTLTSSCGGSGGPNLATSNPPNMYVAISVLFLVSWQCMVNL